MTKQTIGLCLVAIVALILPFVKAAQGSEDRQVGQVPLKDVFTWGGNNLTFRPFDFAKRDREIIRRRPGSPYRRRRPYYSRQRSRDRYYDDDDDSDSDSGSYEERRLYRGRYTDPCNLRRNRGYCPDNQARWFYNNRIGECRPFTYGGCGGNANNFMSRKNCEDYCAGGYKGDKYEYNVEEIEEPQNF